MKWKMEKKGNAVFQSLFFLAIAVILIWIGLVIAGKIGSSAKGTTAESIKLQMQQCKAEVEENLRLGIEGYIDFDRDGCMDTLDPCLAAFGEEQKDTDLDNLPDVCDKQNDNPNKWDCLYYMADSKVFQCCTTRYVDEYTKPELQPGARECKRKWF